MTPIQQLSKEISETYFLPGVATPEQVEHVVNRYVKQFPETADFDLHEWNRELDYACLDEALNAAFLP